MNLCGETLMGNDIIYNFFFYKLSKEMYSQPKSVCGDISEKMCLYGPNKNNSIYQVISFMRKKICEKMMIFFLSYG